MSASAAASAAPRLAYGVHELARSLGVSPELLYTLARRGEVRSVRLGTRVLIPEPEARRLLSTSAEPAA